MRIVILSQYERTTQEAKYKTQGQENLSLVIEYWLFVFEMTNIQSPMIINQAGAMRNYLGRSV
jgi:hypothetical protein